MPHELGAPPNGATVVEPPYPSGVRAWSTVAILFLLYIVSMLDRNLLVLLVAPISKELKLTDFDISLLQGAAFSVCFVLAALPFGAAVDRYSRRAVISIGVFAWSLSTMVSGLSRTLGQFFAARSGVGLGEAALIPAAQSMLADLFPRDRLALPMSIYGLGARVGTSVSLLLVGSLTVLIVPTTLYHLPVLGALSGWKLIFVVAGLPGLLLGALIFLVAEPVRRHVERDRSAPRPSYRDYGRFVARHRRFIIGHHIGYVTIVAVATAMTAWVPAFIARRYGLTPFQVGSAFGSALLVGAVIGMPIHGQVVDWLYAKGMRDAPMRYMMWMTIAATPFGIAAFHVPDVKLTIVLLGVFFALCGCYISLPTAALQLVVPGEFRGKAAGLIVVAGGIASFGLAPSIVAALTDFFFKDPRRIGDSITIFIAVAMPIAAAAMYLCLKPMRAMLDLRKSRQERATDEALVPSTSVDPTRSFR